MARKIDLCIGWGSDVIDSDFDAEVPGNSTILDRECENLMVKMDLEMSIDNFLSQESTPKTYHCCHSWIRDGHSNLSDYHHPEKSLNPTLLEYGGVHWIAHPRVNPLTGFLPLNVDDYPISEGQAGEHQLHSIFREKLKNLVLGLRGRRKHIKFYFRLQNDPLQFCFDPDSTDLYHVIDSADLADRVGLANVLLAAERGLVKHPSSIFLTDVSGWKSSANVLQYVEDSLCAPVSMLPTFYGLKLVTPVHLGSSSPPDLRSHMLLIRPLTRTLSWCWAPAFSNVRLEHTPFLQEILDRFRDKCFNHVIGTDISPYTPQTFHYLTNGMALRTKETDWSQNFFGFEITGHFKLAWETLKNWLINSPVSLHSVELNHQVLDREWKEERSVRLILSSSETYSLDDLKADHLRLNPSYHYFDNLELDIQAGLLKRVSFLLTENHHLKNEILYGYLVDFVEGRLILSLGQLIPNVFEDLYTCSYPYSEAVLTAAPSTESMKPRCVETEEGYNLNLPFPCRAQYTLTDVILPCESANRLSLLMMNKSEIVTMALPHPFVHDSWKTKFDMVGITRSTTCLKKSLEPLPESFTSPNRWEPDFLPDSSLVDDGAFAQRIDYGNISIHLERQFSLESVEPKTSPLNGLRRLYSAIFHRLWPLLKKQDVFFEIGCIDLTDQVAKPKKIEWMMRVHRPVKIAPDGTPMLIVTAFDCLMLEREFRGPGKDISILFEDCDDQSMASFFTRSPAESHLLRSSLRHNSTKIGTSQWQSNKAIPIDVPTTLWLSTFVSPLYADKPRRVSEIVNETKASWNHCQNCQHPISAAAADRSWECNRCLNVFYCSRECKEDHLDQHRYFCSNL